MKLTITEKKTYAEEHQPNPLQWMLLSGTPETSFKNESSWLVCKDFFNDYCVAYNGGPRFNIYGFSTEGMNIPAKGEPVYIAVRRFTKDFVHNVNLLVGVAIHEYDKETLILEIPAKFWVSTYKISLLSLMIRLCNIDHKFKDVVEFKAYKKFPAKDQQKWDAVVAKGVFFNLPEKLRKYIWYEGPDHNNEKEFPVYQLSSLVHNCGCLSYSRYF